jgi:hypothetical protein
MSSLPLLLGRLVFSSAPYPSLQRLTVSCGATFKNVLKVMCNIGRETNASLDILWKRCACVLYQCSILVRFVCANSDLITAFTRTFECVSVVLCLEPMLASPAFVFASATAFVPPAAPLLIAVLKEEFLPIASERMMLL